MRSGTSVSDNCTELEKWVRKAAGEGVKYIQTPEMTGLLERKRDAQFASVANQDNDPVFLLAAGLSKELGIWLHIGSTAISVGNEKLANRAGVFSPDGKLVTTYDKIHMFDVDLDNGESWRESKTYAAGHVARTVKADEFHLGLAVCYDLRFPHLFRQHAIGGANILTCPAAFTKQTGKAHWHTLLQARAIENGAFMVAAAQGGVHQDGRETFGHSLIVNPWGKIIAELEHDDPGCLVAELDLDEVVQARQKIPNLVNAREYSVEQINFESVSHA